MSGVRVRKGDLVRVSSKHSEYFGQVGVVKSITRTRISARLRLDDGRTPTLRLGSLDVMPPRAEGSRDALIDHPSGSLVSSSALAAELSRVRDEVAEMKEVLLRIEKLLLEDEGGEVVVLTSDEMRAL